MKTTTACILLAAPALAFQPSAKVVKVQSAGRLDSPTALQASGLQQPAVDVGGQTMAYDATAQASLANHYTDAQQYVNQVVQPALAGQSQQSQAEAQAEPAAAATPGGTAANQTAEQWPTWLWAALASVGGVMGALTARHVYNKKQQSIRQAPASYSLNGAYESPLLVSSYTTHAGFATRGNMALAATNDEAQPERRDVNIMPAMTQAIGGGEWDGRVDLSNGAAKIPAADSLPFMKGDTPWDPLGLLNNKNGSGFERLRYVELKHGRIAMLAVLGQIVTKAGIRLPGDIDYNGTSFASIDTGFKAFSQVPATGWLQIFFFIGFLELFVMKDAKEAAPKNKPAEFPGDFRNGWIDFGWDKYTQEQKDKKRAIELNNGRAAQMGILALMVHEQLGVSLWPGGI